MEFTMEGSCKMGTDSQVDSVPIRVTWADRGQKEWSA